MCVLSLLPPPPLFGFHFSNIYCLVALGSAPHKYVLLSSNLPLPLKWNLTVDQFAFVFFPALVAGRLFDLGYVRGTLIFASINLVACTFSIAECNQFWQLLLCQGFGIGVSLQKSPSPLTSSSNCPISLDFMWSRIWIWDECYPSLV
jgi:hypothetical protein